MGLNGRGTDDAQPLEGDKRPTTRTPPMHAGAMAGALATIGGRTGLGPHDEAPEEEEEEAAAGPGTGSRAATVGGISGRPSRPRPGSSAPPRCIPMARPSPHTMLLPARRLLPPPRAACRPSARAGAEVLKSDARGPPRPRRPSPSPAGRGVRASADPQRPLRLPGPTEARSPALFSLHTCHTPPLPPSLLAPTARWKGPVVTKKVAVVFARGT